MKRSVFLFCALALAGCSNDMHLQTLQTQTYFEYSEEELKTIYPKQEGNADATVAELLGWDVRLMDIVRLQRLAPTTASKLYAAVAIAQRDAILLGGDIQAVNAAGALAGCEIVPESCAPLRALLVRNSHDLSIATLISDHLHERQEQEKQGLSTPVAPTGSGVWMDVGTTTPNAGSWLPWSKDSLVTIPAPVAFGTPEDLDEVRETYDAISSITEWQRGRVLNWMAVSGSEGAAGMWLTRAGNLMVQHGITSVEQAAQIRAVLTAAMADATIDTWKAKYTYWTPRPSQRETRIGPFIFVPLSPSYPSDHAMVSAAAAMVLGTVFPENAFDLQQEAEEAAESRIWAGIQYRTDTTVGLRVGEAIGKAVLRDRRFSLTPVQ